MTARASFRIEDRDLQRSADGDADAAVLVADGALHLATDPSTAFDQIVEGANKLKLMLPMGSQRRAACSHLVAFGRAAINGDRTIDASHRRVTTASHILELAAEVLGEDAAAKLRRAAAERMGCL